MMRLSEATIRAAFERHATRYGSERRWSTSYHVECWARAHRAFVGGSVSDFEWLYSELRSKWQVFRSRNWNPPSSARVLTVMKALPLNLQRCRLTDIADPSPSDFAEIWSAVLRAANLKTNQDGPSLVALSKFLHFWNPCLFVIADREVIRNWVFGHDWLRTQVKSVKAEFGTMKQPWALGMAANEGISDYVALLVWAGRVLRSNPTVVQRFAEYVGCHCDVPEQVPVVKYEAAAIEWLLLGLVELPPKGVQIEGGRAS